MIHVRRINRIILLLIQAAVLFNHQIQNYVVSGFTVGHGCYQRLSSSRVRSTIIRSASQTALSEFKDWCTSQGILTPLDLKVRGEDNYRYMEYSDDESFTNRPEQLEDGPILMVPLKACITADTPENLSKELAKEKELGDQSFFAPYINVLPSLESKYLQSMPRLWPTEKLEETIEFDGGQIYNKVQMDRIQKKDLNLDPWADACVTSRANYILDKGYAMTPILDFLNHDSASQTSARIIDDDLFLSVEGKNKKGDEVFISYGDLTNIETLCNYGFVSETNSFNKEIVDVKMIRKAPVPVTIDDQSGGSLDVGSLATLRSYLTPIEEIEAIVAKDNNISMRTVYMKPISDSREEEVYSFIASFVDEAIYDATQGIEWAQSNQDKLMEIYYTERVKVLKKGIAFMKKKIPDLLF